MSKKFSDFTVKDIVADSDYVNVTGSGVNRRVAWPDFLDNIFDRIVTPFIYPTIAALQEAPLRADEDDPVYVRVEETEYRLYKITNIAPGEDDIVLENGNTATAQTEYRDIGFVVGPETSVPGSLPTYDNDTGTLLGEGPTPTEVGLNLIEFPESSSDVYFRKLNDNTVIGETATQLKTTLSLNNVNNTSDSDKPISTATQAALDDLEAYVDAADDDLQEQINDRIQSVATIADLRLIEGAADDAQISLAGGDEIRGGLFRRVTDPSLSDDGVDVIRYAATDIYWVREDAEWYNDVHYLHPAIHNTAEVTVYCDPVTGSDTTGDGTLGNPWQTFQKAIDECPSCMLYKYNIDLKASALARGGLPAIYDEDVIIRDFRAPLADPANPFWVSAGIRIFGAGDDHLTDDPDDVQVRSLTISGCSGVANPEVLGLRVNAISPYYEQLEYIGIYGTKEAQLYNVKCSGLGGSGRAVVRAYGSGVSIKGIDITGADHAVWAKRGAYGVVSDCYGTATASTVIVRSEEASDVALISQTVTGLTDARNIVTYNWGLTYDNSGILRVRGMYYGFPVIGSTLGTDALGLGYQFTASGSQSVSVGFNSISAGVTGVAVGAAANSGTQSSNTAIGASAATTGSGGNVGRRATAIGATASAAFENSTGLGYGATPSAANVVRIGNASVTKVETQAAYEVLGAGGAVYLKSPDGTRYALTIANGGAVTVTAAP